MKISTYLTSSNYAPSTPPLTSPLSSNKRQLEYFKELIILFMAGLPLDSVYLPIVTLVQTAGSVADKRLAYLLCCLFHSSPSRQSTDLPLSLLNTLRKACFASIMC